jgi:carotenoid cleavage dioxygenase-like enzyme
MGDGPIATLHLPLRLRPGYHGSWAARREIGANIEAAADQ